LVFYRPNTYQGSAVAIKILLNNQPLVKLKNAGKFSYDVNPGDYEISSSMDTKTALTIKAEAGKTYYIRGAINMGFWAGRPDLSLVTNSFAENELSNGNYKTQTQVPVKSGRNLNRVGIILGYGAGFESIPFFVTDDNKEVSLSTGGGLVVGLEAGCELHKYFDLGFSLLYQSSALTPEVKNADGSFSRTDLMINPSLVIPLKGGEYMRFRIGPGLAYYLGPKMYVDGSKIPHSAEFTWKYENALGLLGNFVFENNFSDNASMLLGIRFNSTKYKYSSTEDNYLPNLSQSKVTDPNGSGIDFYFGFNYHF
jgi:hypothetical protein